MIYLKAVNRELLIEKVDRNINYEIESFHDIVGTVCGSLFGICEIGNMGHITEGYIDKIVFYSRFKIIFEQPHKYAYAFNYYLNDFGIEEANFNLRFNLNLINSQDRLILKEIQKSNILEMLYKDGKNYRFKIKNVFYDSEPSEKYNKNDVSYILSRKIELSVVLTANN
jgi:hypothetical protein